MDIDWFSIMAEEWPERRAAILAWLHDDNFNDEGVAKESLKRNDEHCLGRQSSYSHSLGSTL